METVRSRGRLRSLTGLRTRLALFFIAIVLIPLGIGLLSLAGELRGDQQAAAQRETAFSAQAVAQALNRSSMTLGIAVDTIVDNDTAQLMDQDDREALNAVLQRLFTAAQGVVDFVVVADTAGDVVGQAGQEAVVQGTVAAFSYAQIAQAASDRQGVPGAIVAGRELTDEAGVTIGYIVAGNWIDRNEMATLPYPPGGGIAVLTGDTVWASSDLGTQIDPESVVEQGGELTATDANGAALVVDEVDEVDLAGARILVWQPTGTLSAGSTVVLGIALPAAFIAALAGWLLAGSVVTPITRVAVAARAIAAGDLGRTVVVDGGGHEIEELGLALNTMSTQLMQRVTEMERSRDELRGSLSRLGETLSSSLDLDRTLTVVTETAMETLRADAAILMLFTPERDVLYAKVGRGVGEAVPRLRPGQGRLGWIAAEALAVRLSSAHAMNPESDDLPAPMSEEPHSDRQLLVPMVGRGETLGVLSLMRTIDDGMDFRDEDLETLQSFAAQAAVALENVLLHEEAQRRSLTDPLTGLWNFRHFQTQAARELESAVRFDRPLSLLVLDVDHFKNINDRLGHQAGDEVLRELARRLRESARAPDLVARYGGEEFVVLLPGADTEAARITAERVRLALSTTEYDLGPEFEPVVVTTSIGVASYSQHATDVTMLLRFADDALYGAKATGRDRVVVSGTILTDTASANPGD